MLSVEQTPAKEQTALCGIVDAYNRRNVKKNCTAVQFFSFYERTAWRDLSRPLIEEALRKKQKLFLASSNEMLGKREFDAAGFFYFKL